MNKSDGAETDAETLCPKSPTTSWFSPDGDIKLILSNGQEVFVVASQPLCLISPYWRKMIGPGSCFKEAKEKEIVLPEEDTRGLTVFLNIVHLQFHNVPNELDFETLLSLSILTDKYLATISVRPWIQKWLANLYPPESGDYEEWLWIAWEYGDGAIFNNVANSLALNIKMNDSGKLEAPSGRVFDPLTEYDFPMPPDIIESIIEVREMHLHALLNVVDEYLHKYNHTICCLDTSESRAECDALTCGSLTLPLHRLGLWRDRRGPLSTKATLKDIHKTLARVKVLRSPRHWQFHEFEKTIIKQPGCDFQDEFRERIRNIRLSVIPKQKHRDHLKRKSDQLS
ncbi:uncharacterized protein K452DRAFT_8075 [Aplosporella prunicola CBS 121167]|uniref:BTB domain-containing protein n=1 Tax=Aplosporella prunicola CBS 121167 TaxID=1176127 RepID=A0A6A6BUJ3_9PEZI|nr:uncharacterized protein K452DRAFT_8075 [Aplosporella prunicola CBS 121167]KAF2147488.1 hypothetical protein K452DRAFT_8075 [Aplosporella prunicola CBS 121167]